MMTRVNRDMVAQILGAGWDAFLPEEHQSGEKPAKSEENVDSPEESRNNNN